MIVAVVGCAQNEDTLTVASTQLSPAKSTSANKDINAPLNGVEFDGKGIIRTTVTSNGQLPVLIEVVALAKSAEGEQSVVSNCQASGFCLSIKDGAWSFYWHDGTKYKTISSPVVLEKRTHLLGLVADGRMELWVDGISQGITSVEGHRESRLPFCIAADPKIDSENKYDLSGFEYPFSGVIYECRLSNDPMDIKLARLGYVDKKGDRALFHYVFNQGGDTVQDQSLSKNHCVIENGTWVSK